jgi:NAD(P)-dependent dehydrogenase (short-subunit alcohol dehydrogenase family)
MSTNKKVALVTGANKGLGLETSRQLAQQGIKVLMASRNISSGKDAVSKVVAEGGDAEFVQLEVTDAKDINHVKEYISTNFGKLDILVNNAGIAVDGGGWSDNTVEAVDTENIRKTFDTNFFGVIEVTRALLPLIKKSDAGRIVNMGSILGSLTLHADPSSPIYESKPFAYNASKTALNQFTVHLAASLKGTKIKVNSAHPGWVKTDMGSDAAPMDVVEGSKTGVWLATLGEDGPTGGYFHDKTKLDW